jgi:putative transposase
VEEHVKHKKAWGTLKGDWAPHDIRDEIVGDVNHWTKCAEQPARWLLSRLALGTRKFHDRKHRYGKANECDAHIPRDWWLKDCEKKAIIDYHDRHPLEGYLRLTFMMLDDDVVAVNPARIYRVLKQARWLNRRRFSPSKKGTGFVQLLRAREHWHVDVSYINISDTFYYLTRLLDGHSRFIVRWEIREALTERDVETIVHRALEQHPNEKPWIIRDKGPQFIARDFKEFIHVAGITQVRTSPHYPQFNGTARALARQSEARMRAACSIESIREITDYHFIVCLLLQKLPLAWRTSLRNTCRQVH